MEERMTYINPKGTGDIPVSKVLHKGKWITRKQYEKELSKERKQRR